MDVAVCPLDRATLRWQFAGANRPLWVVRGHEIKVTRPDKFPIGGLQAARHGVFTNSTFLSQKNETIYIFTDGYADQFGGEKDKKLMTTRFKEMIICIQHLDMQEQQKHLETLF